MEPYGSRKWVLMPEVGILFLIRKHYYAGHNCYGVVLMPEVGILFLILLIA